MRVRAIFRAFFYGVAPWWLYEKDCHYKGMSYCWHLGVNTSLALRWATWRETSEDIYFEMRQ